MNSLEKTRRAIKNEQSRENQKGNQEWTSNIGHKTQNEEKKYRRSQHRKLKWRPTRTPWKDWRWTQVFTTGKQFLFHIWQPPCYWGRRGRDRMLVGITTTYAISAYHHCSCEFEPHSWRGVFDTTFCNKVCQWLAIGRWFSPGTPVSSSNKANRHTITEILFKVALNTIH